MVRVYHYTSKQGAEAIEKSKVILGSSKTLSGGDAVLGDGVYVTDLPPDKVTKSDLVMNNYASRNLKALGDKVRYQAESRNLLAKFSLDFDLTSLIQKKMLNFFSLRSSGWSFSTFPTAG